MLSQMREHECILCGRFSKRRRSIMGGVLGEAGQSPRLQEYKRKVFFVIKVSNGTREMSLRMLKRIQYWKNSGAEYYSSFEGNEDKFLIKGQLGDVLFCHNKVDKKGTSPASIL